MSRHDMSKPTSEVPDVPADSGAPAASADSGAPAAPPPGQPRLSRWVAVITLAIALIAIALAAWSLLRPVKASTTAPPVTESTTAPPVTDQQIADAKARACTASNTVGTAVSLQTNASPGDDPAALDAAAANARLSLVAGVSYLLAHLDPATPPPLAAAIRFYADNLQDIAINQLAGMPNDDPAQAARISNSDAAGARIADLCK